MTKITKAQMFAMIKEVEGVKENQAMVDFIDHELELLAKKAGNKKPTKTQEENEVVKAEILNVMSTEGMTVTEIQNKSEVLANLSNQKVSALLRQLVAVGKVEKTVDKKKAYFALVESDEVDE